MANEVEMSARLYANKGGASINSNSFSVVANMTGRDMGQITQDVGTADEALEISSDTATPYRMLIFNMDLANDVAIGPTGVFPFRVPPQQFLLIPLVNMQMFVKAQNSPVKIFVQYCEL